MAASAAVPTMRLALFDLDHTLLSGDSDAYNGKPLAVPLLAHIDALGGYSEMAGGWPTADTLESYVSVDDWSQLYAEWKKKNA